MDATSRILMVVSMGLLLLVAVFFISGLVKHIDSVGSVDSAKASSTNTAETAERIRPVGEVRSEDVTKPRPILSGKQIVGSVCIQCHGSGVLGAPKIGSHGLWAARVGQGYDVLLKHAEEGFKNMPARGGDPRLGNDDLKRAIAYMVGESGFSPPTGWRTVGMPSTGATEAKS
ncbi:hypothetical protein BI364_15755 [Acidihalobacter yilgarnensis]|uniref:Cytochrome c domain-containing protein n=1 Tax=Acidihalobacter yilgarnensis TaxID=2819280 RepID=A0A1D8IRV6_9GAMM|nr:c-type cytochrome [Acidihalobacter yilgarnensis]AOU99196.1 hypothetical protein BI364_15755 [Acidihalobacter yilgarnensis]